MFGIYLLLTTNNNCLKLQGKYLEVTQRPLPATRGHTAVFSRAVWPPAKRIVTQCLGVSTVLDLSPVLPRFLEDRTEVHDGLDPMPETMTEDLEEGELEFKSPSNQLFPLQPQTSPIPHQKN